MSQNKGGQAAKGKKPAKVAVAEEKGEDVLQAVILADSFQDRFMPFAIEKPRCLLPLANTPLLEYTLEYLAMNGVQEVFIYCGAHTNQVETYISESPRWSPTSHLSPFQLLDFIRVSDANSMGDFLRDLDKRSLITSDFILVHGDLVANIPLDAALAKHRARREANRDAIMTMVLRDGGSEDHRTKEHGVAPVFVLEQPSGRCLHYEEMSPLDSEHYSFLDPAALEHQQLEIRADLIDCGIDICTPEVLALWSDSFDFQLPRKNFLHVILKDYELNGKMLYAEIVDEGYAARASNLQMYEAISRDVLGRWTYPMVPDSNLVPGQSYKRGKDGVCSEKGVSYDANASVVSSVVGHRTSLASGSALLSSVVGRRCRIGKNVRLRDCFIWDDVTIGDGATISRSIVASSAVIGQNCTIPPGSLVSFGVQISDDISFPQPVSLSLFSHDRSALSHDTSLLGPSGKGATFDEAAKDEDWDEADPSTLQKGLIYSTIHPNLSTSSISTLRSLSDDSEDADSQVNSAITSDPAGRSRLSSFASDGSAGEALKGTNFHADSVHGLLDALRDDDEADFASAKLEFMGLRLANDASDSAVRRAVAVAFARRASELMLTENGGLEPTKAAESALRGKKGAAQFLAEAGMGSGSVEEQVEFTLALQKALASLKTVEPGRAGTLLSALLQQMYHLDVLEEEGILAWWGDGRSWEGETLATVRDRCRVLVEWLEKDDDDEDEDSEEESDGD